jgi:hypothetical protein
MAALQNNPNCATPFISGRRMQAAQAKWSRLTVEDLSRISNQDQLIARVAARYSLPLGRVRRDVSIWESDTRR